MEECAAFCRRHRQRSSKSVSYVKIGLAPIFSVVLRLHSPTILCGPDAGRSLRLGVEKISMTNLLTKRTILLALGFAIVLVPPGASVDAADLGIEADIAAPPAANERIPRLGQGFVWPPSYWKSMDNPAPATTPETPYQPTD